MALNPNFEQQTTNKLPFCLGWNYVQGIPGPSIFGLQTLPAWIEAALPANAHQVPCQVSQYFLGDGEWDSCWAVAYSSGHILSPTDSLVGAGDIYGRLPLPKTLNPTYPTNANRLLYYHFHGGSWGTIGLPNNGISWGPDQATDNWLNYLPQVIPEQSFSGLAYFYVRVLSPNGEPVTLSPTGIYRTTRCRIFDNQGNVTGYGFTCNPTWQMIETELRFKFKRQQPALAGLTNAERALFDWPAQVAHAQRNALILPNGRQRFTGHFTFAADASLASMMETQLRNCLSFRRIRGSKISYVGEEQRASAFTVSRSHVVPNSISLQQEDLSGQANLYVPQYRDLDMPAIAQVDNVVTDGSPSFSGSTTFTTIGSQPFAPGDLFWYGGGSNDAAYAGAYLAGGGTSITIDNVVQEIVSTNPNQIPTEAGPTSSNSATGGWIGSQNNRFAKRSPKVVMHRAHQLAAGTIAPGVPPFPKVLDVQYDMGNNTFDQTNRVMQFLMARELGQDGPNWRPPLKGPIALFLEGVDANGNAVPELENGDVITLDATASPDFGVGSLHNPTGLYEIVDPMTITTPSAATDGGSDASNVAKKELTIRTYNPNAFTDVSYPVDPSFQFVPGQSLPMNDVLPAQTPFWLLQATPEATISPDGRTWTCTVPDTTVQWMGQPAPTVYLPVSLSEIPLGSTITIYLVLTDLATQPTLLLDTTSVYPGNPEGTNNTSPAPFPYGQVLLYYGQFTAASTFSGNVTPNSTARGGQPMSVPAPAGTSASVVFTPGIGWSGDLTVAVDTSAS